MEAGAGRMPFPFTLRKRGPAPPRSKFKASPIRLRPGEYTPWVRLRFHGGIGVSVYGIARFLLTQIEPQVSLYSTPVNIDPEDPALPI